MATAEPFQCENIRIKSCPTTRWVCYWSSLWMMGEQTWAGPWTSFLSGHICDGWSYSDLLTSKLQRTPEGKDGVHSPFCVASTIILKGVWRCELSLSHGRGCSWISALSPTVEVRLWSHALLQLECLCFHQLLLCCLLFLICTNLTRRAGEMSGRTFSDSSKAQNVSMVTSQMKAGTSWMTGVFISDLMLQTHDVTH